MENDIVFNAQHILADPDISLMSTEVVGAYFLLMCYARIMGQADDAGFSLPDDDKKLARWARMTDEIFIANKEQILMDYELEDGRWIHNSVSPRS